MHDELQEIAKTAETLYRMTWAKNYLSKRSLQELQTLVNYLQTNLDQIAIEAIRLEQDDDAYDRQEAYPITNEPWD